MNVIQNLFKLWLHGCCLVHWHLLAETSPSIFLPDKILDFFPFQSNILFTATLGASKEWENYVIALDFPLTNHYFPAFAFGKTLIRSSLSLRNFMTFQGWAPGFSCSKLQSSLIGCEGIRYIFSSWRSCVCWRVDAFNQCSGGSLLQGQQSACSVCCFGFQFCSFLKKTKWNDHILWQHIEFFKSAPVYWLRILLSLFCFPVVFTSQTYLAWLENLLFFHVEFSFILQRAQISVLCGVCQLVWAIQLYVFGCFVPTASPNTDAKQGKIEYDINYRKHSFRYNIWKECV